MDARAQEIEMREALRRSISLALLDTDDDWADAPVRVAMARANRLHRDLFSERMGVEMREKVEAQVRSIIEATDRKNLRPGQAEVLAGEVAGYVAQAVLEDGVTDGDEWVKEWVSEDDEAVRASHRQAHGQVVPASSPFNVGGHEMSGPHDPNGPIDERAGCRCHVVYRPSAATGDEALVAAAQPMNKAEEVDLSVFVIVGLPAEGDPIHDVVGTVDPAHVTLLYLSADFLEQADQILRGEAPPRDPVTVTVGEQGELGDDGAQVVHLIPSDLADIRDALLEYEPIRQAYDAVEQYPEWTPHLTVGYPETPPRSTDVPATITIDRLAILHDGLHSEYALGEPMSEQTTEVVPDDEFASDAAAWEEVPLYGVLAPEGKPTGDKRFFDGDALEWIEPPLTLRWQEFDDEGHKGSAVTGRMDRIWREDGLIKWEGAASMNEHADRMVALVAERALRGVSVDLDDTEIEFRDDTGAAVDLFAMEPGDPEPIMVVTKGRIRSAAVCAIPAYPEAFIAIGTWADHESAPAEVEVEAEEATEAFVASAAATILAFAPGTQDGPGWLTHPVDTDRLRDYWVHGEGAAKIGWGAPGDFNRCRTLLAPYVKAQHLAGYCANRHKDALGIWPGEHRGGVLAASAITAAAASPDKVAPFYTMVRDEPVRALTASGVNLLKPPYEWFQKWDSDDVFAVTVTEEGRVMGYAAEWGTCHIGYANECKEVPHSPSNYSMYRLGSKLTTEGLVPVGVITIDTGHAPLNLSPFAAAAHYDNTGKVVAQVACGEDEIGIWVAGCIAPTATPEMVDAFRSAKLSGDWRPFGTDLEMIRVLAVNTPGFPVPHTQLALAASADGQGEQITALVAAGIVVTPEEKTRAMVASAVETTLAQRDRAAAMKEISDVVFARRKRQLAALAARRKD